MIRRETDERIDLFHHATQTELIRHVDNRSEAIHAAPDPSPGVDAAQRRRGKVGRDVTVEAGYNLTRLTALSILGSLQRTLGDLDRIVAWNRAFGMVNSASGFGQQANVINGFSDLILELFGSDIGSHCRSAVGMAELPFNCAVEIEGEVTIA
jgi:hypothetical protein